MEVVMSLQHALLGLLHYAPATGYELKSAFTKSIHFFWNATLPQIYRTLTHMEKEGWLTATVQHQEGKPSRKVYHITGAGLEEFRRWLKEPPEMPQPRHPMLLKVFFGNQMDTAQLATHLRGWMEYHASLLEGLEKEVARSIEHYATLKGVSEDTQYWAMALEFGKMHTRMVVDWCDKLLATLNHEEPAKSPQDRPNSPGKRGKIRR